jgi:putative FmdB family regulatory protein
MPTYDYVCDACQHKFEEFQSFSADVLKTCPKCGQDALRRLFGTGAAVLFKGGGFYETDYRSESYKSAAKADSTPPAKTDTSSTPTTSAPPPSGGSATGGKSDGAGK